MTGKALLIAGGAAACTGLFVLFENNPEQHHFFPQCVFYRCTGLYCPGCGATRALYYLMHGDLVTALHDNAMLVILLPYLLWGLYVLGRRLWSRKEPLRPQRMMPPALAWTLAVGVISFGVLRNVPVFPFTALAPLAQVR